MSRLAREIFFSFILGMLLFVFIDNVFARNYIMSKVRAWNRT